MGTSTCSRSVRTRLRTFMRPASRSRVPATSSSSVLCTLSSSSSSRSLPVRLTPPRSVVLAELAGLGVALAHARAYVAGLVAVVLEP